MNNILKKIFQENNFIIVIPAIVVILMIVGFMIYGFSQPYSVKLDEKDTLIIKQAGLEETILSEYSEGTYTETEPFLKVNPYEISPMTALLMFDTEETTNYLLVVKGKTSDADLEFITAESNQHKIPIYGLYEGMNTVELYNYSTNKQIFLFSFILFSLL